MDLAKSIERRCEGGIVRYKIPEVVDQAEILLDLLPGGGPSTSNLSQISPIESDSAGRQHVPQNVDGIQEQAALCHSEPEIGIRQCIHRRDQVFEMLVVGSS